jgi:transposase
MSRSQKQPLRALTEQEQAELTGLARAWGEPAAHVARARALLAVSAGATFTEAARAAGRKSGDGVAKLVGRFNRLGLAAVADRRRSGRPPTYDARQRERILAEARRSPVPAQDGTATWSLSTLQRALRRAPDGLPRVSTAPTPSERCYTRRATVSGAPVPGARRVKRAVNAKAGLSKSLTRMRSPKKTHRGGLCRWSAVRVSGVDRR